MHVLLTDRLSCPRCGPEFGLILLAEDVADRRVLEGRLGCPNCRDRFPVSGGFGDLRAPPRAPLEPTEPRPDPPEEATERLRALLGVAEGPGQVALVGRLAAHAAAIADLTPDLEVVAVDAASSAEPERAGVSRIAARPGLPFFSGTFRGVALAADVPEGFVAEAARVVAPGARVVVLDAPDGTQGRLEAEGLRTLVDDARERVVVAARAGR